ncbi:hypothetical protein IEO21_06252 [Rhodonia placenta]|uniref:Uncharacterized protein n=1 Tax=Rhodonia placenta TaxID=104341 RepID=A0A8H7U1I2_9APHY|nr:hypothetical protein IEO21_06252 [Postia placenta]
MADDRRTTVERSTKAADADAAQSTRSHSRTFPRGDERQRVDPGRPQRAARNGDVPTQALPHSTARGVNVERQRHVGGSGQITRLRVEEMDRGSLEREVHRLRRNIKGHKDTQCKLTAEVEDLQRFLTATGSKLLDTTALLDERTSSLHAAEALLTKVDQHSDADVVRLVKNLNSYILQLSAQIVDSVPTKVHRDTNGPRRQHNLDKAAREAAGERVQRLAGEGLVRLLRSREYEEAAVCQIALQACIVLFSSRIINAWTFKDNSERQLFADVHERMQNSGKLPIIIVCAEADLDQRASRCLDDGEHYQGRIYGRCPIAPTLSSSSKTGC